MDPSIMKLLEDDDDESLHSGADLEAFTAALNREVEGSGPASSSSQSLDHGAGFLPQDSSSKLNSHGQSQGSIMNEIGNQESQQQEQKHLHLKDHSAGPEMISQDSHIQNHHSMSQLEHDQLKVKQEPGNSSQQSIVGQQQQKQHMQQIRSPQIPGLNQTNSAMMMGKNPVIAFHLLIPILSRHLDKDRDMQVRSIFAKLRKNEVSKEHFIRVVRTIVGDQMLKQAVSLQMQSEAQAQRNSQTNQSNYSLLSQVSGQQNVPSASRSSDEQKTYQMAHSMPVKQASDSTRPPQFRPSSTVQMQSNTGCPASESNMQKSRESGNMPDTKGMHMLQNRPSNMHPVSLQPMQHHVQHPQTSLPMYGTNNIHARPFPQSLGGPIPALRPQMPDSNPRAPLVRGAVPMVAGSLPTCPTLQTNQTQWQQPANKEQKANSFTSTTHINKETGNQHPESTQSSFAVLNAKQVHTAVGSSKGGGVVENQSSRVSASTSMGTTSSSQTHHPHGTQAETKMQIQSAAQAPFTVAASKTPQKKPSTGQKKPLEALGSSPPPSSKKQKTSGAFLDQSIDQLNDVTAVSGVNLREEEEQLLSTPKEESRVSEAARKVVQVEEERLILQKEPLRRKLEEIMRKCNLKSIGSDMERCLSMCVEERLRGFISNIIRLSKQRVDVEKSRHRFYPLSSDVRSHILRVNREAREEWDKKQAQQAERLRKQNETDGNAIADSEKDKTEGRATSKNAKVCKEEDDKMRTTAANAAVRVAAGGDDVLSKWQLLAERNKQGSEGGDGSSVSLPGNMLPHKPSPKSGKGLREQQETEKRCYPAIFGPGGVRRSPHVKVARSITVKDAIAALEREPQMSKSSLVFRLYGRSPTEQSTKK